MTDREISAGEAFVRVIGRLVRCAEVYALARLVDKLNQTGISDVGPERRARFAAVLDAQLDLLAPPKPKE